MYLHVLNEDKKLLFRELDLYIAKIDGNFNKLEEDIINFHCAEMQIDNNGYKNKLSIDEIMKQVNTSFTNEEKRMIYLELLSVAMADENYSTEEDYFINELAHAFCIDKKQMQDAFDSLKELKNAYLKMATFIEEISHE